MLRIAPNWVSTYAWVILLMIFLVNVATNFTRTPYSLTLPSMREDLRLSYAQAGSLASASSIVLIIGALVFGTLAPRYGSRVIIGTSTIVAGICTILLGTAPNFIFALVMMALIGFAASGATTPVMGLIAPWFDARNRGTVAGLAAAGGGVAFVITGAAVPWLIASDPGEGWRHAWYLLGLVVIVAGLLALVFIRDRPRDSLRAPIRRHTWPMEAYKNPWIWLIAFLAFTSGWEHGLFTTFFGVYLSEEHHVDLEVTGRLWGLLGLLGIGSGILWGRLSDQLGRGVGFLLTFVAQGVAFLLFWLIPVMGIFVMSSVIYGLTFRAAYTICAASAGDYVAPRSSAAAFGLMSVGAGLGSSISPVIAGPIADATGSVGWAFALAAVGTVAGTLGSFFLRRSRSPHREVMGER